MVWIDQSRKPQDPFFPWRFTKSFPFSGGIAVFTTPSVPSVITGTAGSV